MGWIHTIYNLNEEEVIFIHYFICFIHIFIQSDGRQDRQTMSLAAFLYRLALSLLTLGYAFLELVMYFFISIFNQKSTLWFGFIQRKLVHRELINNEMHKAIRKTLKLSSHLHKF